MACEVYICGDLSRGRAVEGERRYRELEHIYMCERDEDRKRGKVYEVRVSDDDMGMITETINVEY